jgi:hypothetical protein
MTRLPVASGKQVIRALERAACRFEQSRPRRLLDAGLAWLFGILAQAARAGTHAASTLGAVVLVPTIISW